MFKELAVIWTVILSPAYAYILYQVFTAPYLIVLRIKTSLLLTLLFVSIPLIIELIVMGLVKLNGGKK